MIKSPCMKCEERYYGCHSKCDKYQEFAKKKRELNAEILRQKEEERCLMKRAMSRQKKH